MAFNADKFAPTDEREREVWERLTFGRRIHPNDVDDYRALCFWYVVADDCRAEMTSASGTKRVVEDGKPAPFMVALMNAETQIRSLRVLLGIDARTQLTKEEEMGTALDEIRKRREARQARAENQD